MNINYVLSQLLDDGYGKQTREFSKSLGKGLWEIEIGQTVISLFEGGFRYRDDYLVEINYDEVIGIKSSMTIDKLSKAQSKEISTLFMRFECESSVYDLSFPIFIYSSLLGYFCDQAKQAQNRNIATGFMT